MAWPGWAPPAHGGDPLSPTPMRPSQSEGLPLWHPRTDPPPLPLGWDRDPNPKGAPPAPQGLPTLRAFFSLRLCLALLSGSSPGLRPWGTCRGGRGSAGSPHRGGPQHPQPPQSTPGAGQGAAPSPRAPPAPGWTRRCSRTRSRTLHKGGALRGAPRTPQRQGHPAGPPLTSVVGLAALGGRGGLGGLSLAGRA